MSTREVAIAAPEKLHSTLDVANHIGVPPSMATGPFWARRNSVSASSLDHLDHLDMAQVPTSVDESHIPPNSNGVWIVVDLVDRRGAASHARDPLHGPRQ